LLKVDYFFCVYSGFGWVLDYYKNISNLDSFCKILYGESESLFTTVWHEVGFWSTQFFPK